MHDAFYRKFATINPLEGLETVAHCRHVGNNLTLPKYRIIRELKAIESSRNCLAPPPWRLTVASGMHKS